MILLERITRYYGIKLEVNAFSMRVKDGETCVLIGPSGCGKTTLLKTMNRLIEPTSGNILIDDKDTSLIKPGLLRHSIGFATQNAGLFPHMTVAQNISVVPELLRRDKKQTTKRTGELLELVGLNPERCIQKYPHQLSGAEAQRIGVAHALAADPPILLMDESFGAALGYVRTRGVRSVPVIKADLPLIGEISLNDIESATAEKDSHNVQPQVQELDIPAIFLAVFIFLVSNTGIWNNVLSYFFTQQSQVIYPSVSLLTLPNSKVKLYLR